MLELKKNAYIKIGEFAYLCYINKWSEDEYIYVLAVNSYPGCFENEREIFGFGKTAEEALLSGIEGILKSALKGLPLSSLKYIKLDDLYEFIQKDQGYIECDEVKVVIQDDEDDHVNGNRMSVLIKEDMCIPYSI